jgi:hypothetical protein
MDVLSFGQTLSPPFDAYPGDNEHKPKFFRLVDLTPNDRHAA